MRDARGHKHQRQHGYGGGIHLRHMRGDRPMLRSVVWVIGIACPIALLVMAALGARGH